MRYQPLAPEEIDAVHAATLRVLIQGGVVFDYGPALDLLTAAGAQVDFSAKRVRFPEALVERALQTTSGHFWLWDRGGKRALDLQDGQVRGHNVGGCVRVYDAALGGAREASREDLAQMTVLLDGLEHIQVCRPVVYPQEYPAARRDIFTTATILQYTAKPYGVTAYSPQNLETILEVTGAISGGLDALRARPFIWGSVCPNSPFYYSASTTAILMRYAELGLPAAIAPCPIAGGTSPVTLAGTLVQLNAEFLAGLVLVQTIRPGLDLKYTARPMPMDLRTANATFGPVEMGLMSAGVVQLAQRYRVCSDAYGLGTRSRSLDGRAAFEKSLNGLLVALAGADLVAAAGLLEDALTSSVEQLVIDDEILGQIFRAVRGFEVTPETLAAELIVEVGPGGSFLTDEHTRAHMRREHVQPRLCYRVGFDSWQEAAYETVVEAARDRAAAILATHEAPLLEPALVAEIERILHRS